jgi:hypothetical protein
MQVAALYAGHADFDPSSELVANWSLHRRRSRALGPAGAALLADTGLRKRADLGSLPGRLQRREDAGEKPTSAKIPVPPKYQSKDFLKADFWRLRGGLDVPKERWVSYPGCERGADGSLVIAWAGWDHLQQATALATYYLDMKETTKAGRPRACNPCSPACSGTGALAQAVAQRPRPHLRRAHGRLLRRLRAEEARALGLHAGRPAGVEAGGDGEAWARKSSRLMPMKIYKHFPGAHS